MAKRITLTLSDDLAEAAELLRRQNRYRTIPELCLGLLRYAGLVQKEHVVTSEIAAMSPAERDIADAQILDRVKRGEAVKGQWFENRLKAIVEAYFEEHGRPPSKREAAVELVKGLGE